MRAYYLEGHGPPENLRLREVPEPEPGPREVAVQIEAIGVNYAEILSRKGMYGWAPDLPYILGMEATGRIASVGSDEKLARVKAIGADLTVNYSHPAFDILLEQAVGERRVDVVLEVVGGEVFRRCFAALGPFGRVVVAGFASMDMSRRKPWTWWRTWRDLPRAKVMKLARASKGIMATHIGYLLDDERRLRDVWNGLTRFVAEHDIRPVVGATFPFDQMAEAHHLMERRGNVGKIAVGMAGSSS